MQISFSHQQWIKLIFLFAALKQCHHSQRTCQRRMQPGNKPPYTHVCTEGGRVTTRRCFVQSANQLSCQQVCVGLSFFWYDAEVYNRHYIWVNSNEALEIAFCKLTVLADRRSKIKHLFLPGQLWPNITSLFLKVRLFGLVSSFVSSHARVESLNRDLTILTDRNCSKTYTVISVPLRSCQSFFGFLGLAVSLPPSFLSLACCSDSPAGSPLGCWTSARVWW